MKQEKFDAYKLIGEIKQKVENHGLKEDGLKNTTLNDVGDFLVHNGYDATLIYVMGIYDKEQGNDYEKNKEVLAIIDIIEFLKQKNLTLNFSSYIISKLVNILHVYTQFTGEA